MREERGFTLIEVMVTMLVLVVGISGAVALIDGANARTLANKDREAGNALTREVIEAARSVPYRQLGGTSLKTLLQTVPGLADTTPSTVAWTVERRKQTYTIDVSVCSVDDDQDGYGNTAGGGFCVATAGTADRNPDDYKRLSLTASWTRRGVTKSVKQTGIINNEASSAGPDVEFTSQPANPVTVAVSNLKFGVKAEDDAVALRFAVDGVELDSQMNTTSYLFSWDIDTGSKHVPDGTYVVSVTAFDIADTPGPTRSLTIRLNRDAPLAPQDVFGGWNPRIGFTDANDIVEVQWARNDEPDIKGYRVYYGPVSSPTIVPGCDFPADPAVTECRDMNPPAGATIEYFVRALDEDPSTGSLREGANSAVLTAVRASTQPNQPATLTATADGDDVVLNWDPAPAHTPPYTGSDVIFYRVYRDGKALGDRVARTSQDVLTSFRDDGGAAGSHTYYVTSVDENFSESAPLGPVSAP
ncbi:MAG TPA: prepilin-type N-terminal cleavage/methylation domain-containing protein [Thermoleophilaceae bacterium]|nr:prepilin-type N-terminal cleavage/methylation domain-containing protein [Thermoleophilaceae bacterium]